MENRWVRPLRVLYFLLPGHPSRLHIAYLLANPMAMSLFVLEYFLWAYSCYLWQGE